MQMEYGKWMCSPCWRHPRRRHTGVVTFCRRISTEKSPFCWATLSSAVSSKHNAGIKRTAHKYRAAKVCVGSAGSYAGMLLALYLWTDKHTYVNRLRRRTHNLLPSVLPSHPFPADLPWNHRGVALLKRRSWYDREVATRCGSFCWRWEFLPLCPSLCRFFTQLQIFRARHSDDCVWCSIIFYLLTFLNLRLNLSSYHIVLCHFSVY